jgi:hypothetical protein
MEFLRLLHEAEGFPVTLRVGHGKVSGYILLRIPALLLRYHGNRDTAEEGNSSYD